MSSILKALQKLEKDTAQEIGGDGWPHKIDAGRTLHKQTRRSHLFGGLFLVLFAILGAGVAAGLFYFWKSGAVPDSPLATAPSGPTIETPAPAPPQMVAKGNPPAPIPKKASRPSADRTKTNSKMEPKAVIKTAPGSNSVPFLMGQNVKTKQPPPASDQISPGMQPQTKKTPPFPFRRKDHEPETDSKPSAMRLSVDGKNRLVRTRPPTPPPSVPGRSSDAPPRALSKPAPAEPQYEVYKKKAPAAALETSDPTPEEIRETPAARADPGGIRNETAIAAAHSSIPEKSSDESGLKIQALVWSSDPDSRLAVINGNVTKQGGNVGGAVLSFIGEDYILIRQGGEEWKVRFQIK